MKNIITALFIFGGFFFVHGQNKTIDYLGQSPPGDIPELFAPGIISTGHHERSLVFSPKRDELFYQIRGRRYTTFIIHMQKIKNNWSKPEVATFSGSPMDSDDCPFFSPDGETLFFASKKPIPGTITTTELTNIWKVTKTDNGWGNPEFMKIINSKHEDHYPSLTLDGTIYFNSNRDGNYDIYKSEYRNGNYTEPVRLESPINSDQFEGHPFIAPDESYLIFSADRPDQLGNADLYISFQNKDHSWTEPINMGNNINTKYHEAAPYVSPDGKFLFFVSFRYNPDNLYPDKQYKIDEIKKMLDSPGNGNGDIYWVSTDIITELKQKVLK